MGGIKARLCFVEREAEYLVAIADDNGRAEPAGDVDGILRGKSKCGFDGFRCGETVRIEGSPQISSSRGGVFTKSIDVRTFDSLAVWRAAGCEP